MVIRDIVEGHFNEVADKNSSLSEVRMRICEKCPLYKMSTFGPICNNSLYMDSEGNVSTNPLPGYKKGCGCRLKAKTRLDRATCAHGK
jgi:hypothetical protein